jgi:hypothetical protein
LRGQPSRHPASPSDSYVFLPRRDDTPVKRSLLRRSPGGRDRKRYATLLYNEGSAIMNAVNAPELRSVIEAAEHAATSGDFGSAEQFLRQAARLQESQLGPLHPDLASTLNNLGVACESVGKPADAEECYRRAYAIVTSVLAADDPVVITSGKNLRDFCDGYGRPFELPPSPSTVAPQSGPARTDPPAASTAHETAAPEPPATAQVPSASTRVAPVSVSRLAIVVALVVGVALVMLVTSRSWFDADEPAPPPTDTVAQVPLQAAPPPPSAEARVNPPPERPTPTTARRAAAGTALGDAGASAPVAVADARLCRNLSTTNWRCSSVTTPAAPGTFSFYTRLKSARETTVQHRWYYKGSLVQNATRRVGANEGAGYRTYSRHTVIATRTGDWKVELRTAAGALLLEKRFVVR